jgi:hypothetical protein
MLQHFEGLEDGKRENFYNNGCIKTSVTLGVSFGFILSKHLSDIK